ncbi:ABC1 kinase family protein [Lederbergia wuyishanensis]|uniref:Unusual protein kinase regulating ubiquinone biosynthesis (AarF/ABC1/UbiB family) n=1 Tax=Lederbergia wuyishanensis TaxID=1347903 RepID=A0ABU0D079_9BACI|nr:AarF/UbiB family protein [Lederbergia wuyishanensis]MCJ8006423.1 AarF/UbiB family protein [Lederbergia wuyishanensis]MDQ0341798.1 putative unusual protein kinase regulating ubiquinone biosynthesis (AarF/ABC1/UbiB family) [Lederbergia wuyishanensis]
MKKTNKLFRIYKVLSMFFICFLQIYSYKILRKSEADWDKLWEKIGERFRKTLFELEGLLIKIGQMLSIRGDLLPYSFIRQIQDLTDNVPPSDFDKIQDILEKEWGGTIDQYLLSIEKKAIASASIGEVYKGILNDGSKVAIKVQRPNIESIIRTDFRTLSFIIWFVDHLIPIPKGFINLKVLFKELKEVIERELDFVKEQNSLHSFKERFKDVEDIIIPSVYTELSTSKVLVMEWMEGVRLTNVEALDRLSINRNELAQNLISIFLPQWLEAGMFHADPHPGNVLVTEEGKIILLDFGMIGEITKTDAAHFQALIESILSKNYSKAVESFIHLGFLLPEADTRTMERLLAELMSFSPSQLKEIDLIALKLEMNDLIRALPIQVPTRFVFLGRSFVTIEGMIRELVPEEEIIVLVKPVFMDWLEKHGNNMWSFVWHWIQSQPLFRIVYSLKEFLTLPQQLEHLKEVEQRRQFQFTIYENNKKRLYQLILIGMIGIPIGFYLTSPILWKLAIGIFVIGSVGYIISNSKQKKWLKYMQDYRRG